MTVHAQPSASAFDLARWRMALVYGLGVSGRAAVRLLAHRGVRAEGVDRIEPADLEALPGLARFYREDSLAAVPTGTDGLVLSPGVPPDRPLVEDARRRQVPVLAEVEIAYRHLRERLPDDRPVPLVAITGSNGKSTTTALTGALLEAAGRAVQVCGNIGTAFSEAVLETEGDPPADCVFVVELSSFQVEGLHDFHPRAAAYLNLSPDHMDRYPSVDAYAAAKERLLTALAPDDTAVLNLDDERSAHAASRARKRFFSRLRRPGAGFTDGCYLDGERVVEVEPSGAEALLFERDDLRLAGEHNLENAMAAALLARALGASREAIRQGLAAFHGLPHRMERVGEQAVPGGTVTFWNDSKGTNPAATLRSLEGLPDGTVHLILGGRAKGTDFRPMAPLVRRKVKHLYLIGEAASEIGAALEGAAPRSHSRTLDRAVAEAAEAARAGESVLLSPACASFDQFRSFAHRGDEFRRLVHGLTHDLREEGRDGEQAGV